MYKLIKLRTDMGNLEYQMYQNIPKNEVGSSNEIKDLSFEEYKKILIKYVENEKVIDEYLDTKTNRYIFYFNDEPIGEVGIRTTFNDYWENKGSQIFYKLKLSARNRGHGTKMLKYALEESKKLGFTNVGINCNKNNLASKKIIEKNGGQLAFKYNESLRYKINLK